MKLDIVHDITYRYDAPVRSSTQYFRLTPRESPRHRVLEWAVDTPVPATRTRDGYGNVLHVLTLAKPGSEIRNRAHGVVETPPSGDAPGDGGDPDAGERHDDKRPADHDESAHSHTTSTQNGPVPAIAESYTALGAGAWGGRTGTGCPSRSPDLLLFSTRSARPRPGRVPRPSGPASNRQ